MEIDYFAVITVNSISEIVFGLQKSLPNLHKLNHVLRKLFCKPKYQVVTEDKSNIVY